MTSASPRIAVLSSKGGTGKTTVAVTIANHWAAKVGPVTLVDVDQQDTGSATWWLDRTDDNLPNLSWAKATISDLVENLDRLDGAVVIDTPPRLDDPSVYKVAKLATVILVPGAIWESATIQQTHETIRQATTSTPVWVVITRTRTDSLATDDARGVLDVLRGDGLRILGAIRQNQALATAGPTGRRPDQLTGRAGGRVVEDLDALAVTATMEES